MYSDCQVMIWSGEGSCKGAHETGRRVGKGEHGWVGGTPRIRPEPWSFARLWAWFRRR
jgi:hypothetical protein